MHTFLPIVILDRVCVAEIFHFSLSLKCSLSPGTSSPGSAVANRGNPQLSQRTQLRSVAIHGCKLAITSESLTIPLQPTTNARRPSRDRNFGINGGSRAVKAPDILTRAASFELCAC